MYYMSSITVSVDKYFDHTMAALSLRRNQFWRLHLQIVSTKYVTIVENKVFFLP